MIVLAILTAVLHFGLRYYITPPLGEDVKDRFIERDKFIPSLKNGAGQDGGKLTATNLRQWIHDPANLDARKGYVTPVILPLDLLFLIAAGCLLGFTSQMLAGKISLVGAVPVIAWWTLPVAYMFSDFAEDGMIVTLLSWPGAITDASFQALRLFTMIKLYSIGAAIIQAGLLIAGWLAARAGFIA
ncbi:hypothetical protein XH99_00270 [Bradyrhizobium nanningense]|uniref:Uncharacterized protein n=1 Tax=Bradyrhizobium nanningense TaxID=1325118 RepID=A0A4Q0SL31_9BRAD|nr:hypothetical protein [Bradyrhizobium nanningense]RXH38731.1 hypothetical protein XH99_00270 [Bradyrhizobium nanningense]